VGQKVVVLPAETSFIMDQFKEISLWECI